MIFKTKSNIPLQIDRYKVLSQLGRGGFGRVYHVVDVDDNSKEYALKLLNSSLNIARIKDQLDVLKILNSSKFFLKTYFTKKISGTMILLMQYSNEKNLYKILSKKPFSENQTYEIVLNILDALEFLNNNNIIHGDIKAENIIKKDDFYYLIDYDLVKRESPSKTIHILNDDDFTAPEIYKGYQTYSSDIYALGSSVYHLLRGKHIFGLKKEDNFSQKMFAHIYLDRFVDENISNKMLYLIRRMTDKNDQTRASIEEIRDIIDDKIKIVYEKSDDKTIEDNFNSELDRYMYMANDGISYAQNILGLIYENGNEVDKNMDEAFKWYSLSASQGLAKAEFNLGLCYKYAKGCEIDYKKAMLYFMKAAEQKHGRSFYYIGDIYENGLGVDVDNVKAKKYYERSALHGYRLAYKKLKKYR